MQAMNWSELRARVSAPLILRVGVAACFIGHGAFGVLQKPEWVVFFQLFGIADATALRLMPLIGTVDIAIGLLALLAPSRALFAYAFFWCLLTAALRPIIGLSIAETLERAGNYGVPLALLLLAGRGPWLQRFTGEHAPPERRHLLFTVSQLTTAVLLIGHGLLALQGKPLLQEHVHALGLPAEMTFVMGMLDLSAAIAVLILPSAPLFAAVAIWKLGTEGLFLVAGAPVFEFIERGGSYAAPLAAAWLLARAQTAHRVWTPFTIARARTLLGAPVFWLIAANASAQQSDPPPLTAAVIQELRKGGLVVACRHAITSHDREDRTPVNFDDPSTQRVLSPEGEQQARKLGEDLRAIDVRFGQVLASPFQRTRLSAELMFGRVTIENALSSMTRGKDADLTALVTTPVPVGENRLLMTHQGLLYRVFTTIKHGTIGEGSCVVARPTGSSFELMALAKPADWIQR